MNLRSGDFSVIFLLAPVKPLTVGQPPSIPAGVHVVLPDASPEEAFAAIAARSTVMLPCGTVPTDGTQRTHPDAVGGIKVGCF